MVVAIRYYCRFIKEEKKNINISAGIALNNTDESVKSESTQTVLVSLFDLLNMYDISYVDNREKNGCLWIIGGVELEEFVKKCSDYGVIFHYKVDGARATDNKSAWWTRDDIQQPSQPKNKEPQKPVSEIDELLADELFLPLRYALAKKGIRTVEELKALQLWAFMNQNNLYSISVRQEVLSKVRELLNPVAEVDSSRLHKLYCGTTIYLGESPSLTFVHFCEYIASKYPLFFRSILDKKIGNDSCVCIYRIRKNERCIKIENPTCFISAEMTKDEVVSAVKWICHKCGYTQGEIYIEEPVPSHVKIPQFEKRQQESVEIEKDRTDLNYATSVESGEYQLDFTANQSLAYTKPCYFSYFQKIKRTCSSWTDLYVTFFAALYEDYSYKFKPGMSFSVRTGRVELTTRSNSGAMVAPKIVPGTNYVIETNISANDIVRKMIYLMDFCAVDYENVVVKYCRQSSDKKNVTATNVHTENMTKQNTVISRLSFYNYLLNKRKLAPATCRSYSSAIANCEAFAKEHYYESWHLYTSDLNEAKAVSDALFRDSAFIEYNDRWHNQLKAAIAKLLEFIEYDAEEFTYGSGVLQGKDIYEESTEKSKKEVETTRNSIDKGNDKFNSEAVSKVEKIVLNADMNGVTYDDLYNALNTTMVAIKAIVAESEHVVEIKGRLYHVDAFVDWNEGAEQLCKIVEKLMQKNDGYISASQLYDYAHAEMNMFLNDNDVNDERSVYEIAQHLFEKDSFGGHHYIFTGKSHISRSEESIGSNFDVFCKFAEDQGGVFREEDLVEYLDSIGIKAGNLHNQMRMYKEPDFFFYDEGVIISARSMKIDDLWKENVTCSLKKLFDDVGDHIILREIQPIWFEHLPALPGHRKWTPLLLQNILRFYGKEFGAKTIAAMETQSMDTLHTMLVKRNSPMQNFGDVVVSYLIENGISQRTFEAESLRRLLVYSKMIQGNELIWNMSKALSKDERFAWDAKGENVTIRV